MRVRIWQVLPFLAFFGAAFIAGVVSTVVGVRDADPLLIIVGPSGAVAGGYLVFIGAKGWMRVNRGLEGDEAAEFEAIRRVRKAIRSGNPAEPGDYETASTYLGRAVWGPYKLAIPSGVIVVSVGMMIAIATGVSDLGRSGLVNYGVFAAIGGGALWHQFRLRRWQRKYQV